MVGPSAEGEKEKEGKGHFRKVASQKRPPQQDAARQKDDTERNTHRFSPLGTMVALIILHTVSCCPIQCTYLGSTAVICLSVSSPFFSASGRVGEAMRNKGQRRSLSQFSSSGGGEGWISKGRPTDRPWATSRTATEGGGLGVIKRKGEQGKISPSQPKGLSPLVHVACSAAAHSFCDLY